MKRADDAHQHREFPAIEELMPHRGTVVLLHGILRHDSESTDARVSIAKQKWLKRENGTVAGSLAVEYMAQCVAAHEGLLALEEGRPPPKGFLVGVTGLRLEVSEFAADAELRVRTRRLRGRPSLGALSHQCEVHLERFSPDRPDGDGSRDELGRMLAQGRLSVSVWRDSAS
jgi:predicted hotdog family 3-hydroxylacyl-ACP dehydratase